MGFTVVPDGLDRFGAQVDRAADAARDSKAYVERYAEVGSGGDAFNLARSAHERAVGGIGSSL
ncbi:MAG: hypothetical protein HKP61_12330 [Dactylosporangium sp.]|nr:hypothetical protein [Dactylosporangium sp.]NNJ61706.1 hypothetical protein [Dactylosporangium sp.]